MDRPRRCGVLHSDEEMTEGLLHASTLPVKGSLISPAQQAPSCWSILVLLHDLVFTPEALV